MAGSGGSSSSGTSKGSSDTGALIRHLLGVIRGHWREGRAGRSPPPKRLAGTAPSACCFRQLLRRATRIPPQRHGAEADEDEREIGDVDVLLEEWPEPEADRHHERAD